MHFLFEFNALASVAFIGFSHYNHQHSPVMTFSLPAALFCSPVTQSHTHTPNPPSASYLLDTYNLILNSIYYEFDLIYQNNSWPILQIFGIGSVAQMVLSNWKFGNFFSVNFSWGIGVTLGCYWAGGVSGLYEHVQYWFNLKHRGYSFERNCVLRRWESETLKLIINHKVDKVN